MSVIRARSRSIRYRPRTVTVTLCTMIVALAVAVVTIGTGDYPMSPAEVLATLFGFGSDADTFVVNELRLPRVIAALLVGTAFGLGGAIFQSLTRNPLGSPDILGFTQGAATGALTVILVIGGSGTMLATGAVTGCLLTGTVLYLVAGREGLGGFRLILVGIGMTAILTGVNGYLLTRAQIFDAARAMRWLTGSLDGREWHEVAPLALALLILTPIVLSRARAMSMLDLGDAASTSLGVRTDRLRITMLACAVGLVGFASATAGPVAFVALMAPQVARRLTAASEPNLAPSACVGAALLVCADWIAQRAVPGHLLPVGVVTGLLGGGYLVWLLVAQRKAGRI